ncbi:hypothetical protein ES703_112318 [subsurface metagenome]
MEKRPREWISPCPHHRRLCLILHNLQCRFCSHHPQCRCRRHRHRGYRQSGPYLCPPTLPGPGGKHLFYRVRRLHHRQGQDDSAYHLYQCQVARPA